MSLFVRNLISQPRFKMSEVKNIPRLRFPNYYDSYRKLRFGDIFKSLPTGMTPSRTKKEYFQGDIPWITSGELEYNEVYQTVESITEEAINKTNLKVYPKGTFFIAITGLEAPGTRGRCAINAVPSTTNQSCMAFQENDKIINRFLFYWYLRYGVKLYFKYAQGSKQQSFNAGIVKAFELIIPSIPEQQKIADFLTAVDIRIELLEKKRTLLETYKKGVMKKIFNQEIRFKDDNGNDFPDWEETTLGKLAKITTGDSNRSDSESFGDYMFFDRSVDVRMSSTYSFDTEAIIVAGEGKDFIPRYYNGKFGLHQRTYAIYDFINSDAKFLYYWIYYFRYFFLKTSVGSTMPSLRMNSFTKFPVTKPTKEEQVKISKFLSSIDDQIELLENQIDKSKTWKKGLLQKMFV